MDTMDSQEEPFLSEAFSCSTLLTECGGVIDSTDPKSALLNSQVISKRVNLLISIKIPFLAVASTNNNSFSFLTNK